MLVKIHVGFYLAGFVFGENTHNPVDTDGHSAEVDIGVAFKFLWGCERDKTPVHSDSTLVVNFKILVGVFLDFLDFFGAYIAHFSVPFCWLFFKVVSYFTRTVA